MSNSEKSNSGSRPVRTRSPVPLELCGMARAAEILGDRWSLLILREAFYGVVRFADIQADIKAPRAALAERLNKLVEAGLLTRFDYKEEGARARKAYQLTKRGQDLAVVLLAMKQWWDEGEDQPAKVQFVPKRQSTPVRVALIDENGELVDPRHLKVEIAE